MDECRIMAVGFLVMLICIVVAFILECVTDNETWRWLAVIPMVIFATPLVGFALYIIFCVAIGLEI